MLIREITCKSLLTPSGIALVDYALNPYVGCAHACVYCYASFMKRFTGHDEPWGSFVDVRVNAPDVLARQLRRNPRGVALLSSVTDPYQAVERRYRVTRGVLEALEAAPGLEVQILTKSDLVLRDLDLLHRLPKVTVGFTITAEDDAVSKRFEPGAPPASRRFAALDALAAAGISTWVLFGPVLPYFSDNDAAIGGILERLARARVQEVVVDKLNLYPTARAGFERVLRQHFPEALPHWQWLLHNEAEYADQLRLQLRSEAQRLGLPLSAGF